MIAQLSLTILAGIYPATFEITEFWNTVIVIKLIFLGHLDDTISYEEDTCNSIDGKTAISLQILGRKSCSQLP